VQQERTVVAQLRMRCCARRVVCGVCGGQGAGGGGGGFWWGFFGWGWGGGCWVVLRVSQAAMCLQWCSCCLANIHTQCCSPATTSVLSARRRATALARDTCARAPTRMRAPSAHCLCAHQQPPPGGGVAVAVACGTGLVTCVSRRHARVFVVRHAQLQLISGWVALHSRTTHPQPRPVIAACGHERKQRGVAR
jgi:hypothetical protein